MIRVAATMAIVRERLRRERAILLFTVAGAGLIGYISADDGAARFGMLGFAALIAITAALAQRPGRMRALDAIERAAPLFGRELARARALVPAAVGIVATLAAWLGSALAHRPASGTDWLIASAAAVVSALIALSATLREGIALAAYVGLAMTCAAVVFATAAAHVRFAPAIALFMCAIAGYVALRQYGELLARHDDVG